MRTTTATPTVAAFDHRSVVRYTIITTVLGLAIMTAPALILLNLWEETGWQGMVQRHFMGRHGLVKGSLLTAVPFAVVHIPLQIRGMSGLREALVTVGVLFLMAPAARYLVGRSDCATGGSLLAVGVLHASWNASGQLSVVDGDLQYVIGLVIVAVVALVVDVVRSQSDSGVLSDHPAARTWRPRRPQADRTDGGERVAAAGTASAVARGHQQSRRLYDYDASESPSGRLSP